jgi:bifunctional non-homologous end joining protein LigD
VPPYSLRAVAAAPLSAPFEWSELWTLERGAWTIGNICDRLADKGDLFSGALVFDQELPELGVSGKGRVVLPVERLRAPQY